MSDDGPHLDLATVKDWARITLAFALEWLDMMEVEPAEAAAAGKVGGSMVGPRERGGR